MTYLFVGSAESETNMVQVEAVFREVLKMGITIEASVKGCLRFLELVLASGPVCVC